MMVQPQKISVDIGPRSRSQKNNCRLPKSLYIEHDFDCNFVQLALRDYPHH